MSTSTRALALQIVIDNPPSLTTHVATTSFDLAPGASRLVDVTSRANAEGDHAIRITIEAYAESTSPSGTSQGESSSAQRTLVATRLLDLVHRVAAPAAPTRTTKAPASDPTGGPASLESPDPQPPTDDDLAPWLVEPGEVTLDVATPGTNSSSVRVTNPAKATRTFAFDAVPRDQATGIALSTYPFGAVIAPGETATFLLSATASSGAASTVLTLTAGSEHSRLEIPVSIVARSPSQALPSVPSPTPDVDLGDPDSARRAEIRIEPGESATFAIPDDGPASATSLRLPPGLSGTATHTGDAIVIELAADAGIPIGTRGVGSVQSGTGWIEFDILTVASAPELPSARAPSWIVALAVATIGIASLPPVFRRWAPWVLAPLYSRLDRREMLAHETRSRMLRTISENPGSSLSRIQALLDLPNGTFGHHLRKLQTSHLVRIVKHGRNSRVYTTGEKAPPGLAPTAERILGLVPRFEPISARDLGHALRISKQLVHYHLKLLSGNGSIHLERIGKEIHARRAAVEPINAQDRKTDGRDPLAHASSNRCTTREIHS